MCTPPVRPRSPGLSAADAAVIFAAADAAAADTGGAAAAYQV